jgi:hypothetical protein
MTKAKNPTNTRLNKTSRLLTTAERRAFICESPRLCRRQGALYYVFVNAPEEDFMAGETMHTVERYGVKAAFQQLFGHTHIERTLHGFWVVGSPDDGTLMAFDNMEGAAEYAQYLYAFYLAQDTGLCPDCGGPVDAKHAQESKTKPTPKLELVPKNPPPPPSATH